MFNDLSELRAELKSQVTELGLTEDFDASEEERKMKEADHGGKVVEGIDAVRGELKGISSSVLALLEKKIPAPEVNVDLKSVVSAIKKLETAIPSYKPQEIADYSKVLSDILAASKRKEIDLTPIIESLEALAKKESPVFTIPKELVTKDNRIRVEVDRAGSTGHRSTLSSTESAKLLTLATEAKQDAIVTAISGITPATGGATETKQDTQIVNQETLLSLIGTLQELNARLMVIAGMANAGAPALRVIPIASVSTAVTGTLGVSSVASITNFGVGVPAKEVSDDMNNLLVTLANINNASAA